MIAFFYNQCRYRNDQVGITRCFICIFKMLKRFYQLLLLDMGAFGR